MLLKILWRISPKYLITLIFRTFAAFERNLIKERTRAGLKAVRFRRNLEDRKKKLSSAQVLMLRTMYESKEHNLKEICNTFGISKPTLYRYLNQNIWKVDRFAVTVDSSCTGQAKSKKVWPVRPGVALWLFLPIPRYGQFPQRIPTHQCSWYS